MVVGATMDGEGDNQDGLVDTETLEPNKRSDGGVLTTVLLASLEAAIPRNGLIMVLLAVCCFLLV